jgi:NADPH-dependent curcumin reductase CurA
MLDMVMTRLAMYGRIVACGAIASYKSVHPSSPSDITSILLMGW